MLSKEMDFRKSSSQYVDSVQTKSELPGQEHPSLPAVPGCITLPARSCVDSDGSRPDCDYTHFSADSSIVGRSEQQSGMDSTELEPPGTVLPNSATIEVGLA